MPVQNGDGSWDDDEIVVPENAPSSANASTQSSGPGPLSTAPVTDAEPHPVTVDESSSEEIPEFDPRYRQDFEGLLYIGKLTDTFSWLGHTFELRTLTTGEILEVGLLHRKYAETLADLKAYQAAVCAASIISVDGRPIAVPITNEIDDTRLANKFRYILNSWFPPVLDVVYDKYLQLEERVRKALEEMGKVQG